jgi:hypothetical protein
MATKDQSFANCFTINRFGAPQVGITVSGDPGHDLLRPLPQRVVVGHRYVPVDSRTPAEVVDGKLMRAEIRHINNAFKVLTEPQLDRPKCSLVRVSFMLPGKKSPIMVDGFPVQLYTGFSGGRLIEKGHDQALIELAEGERLSVFYEDGAVRQWVRQGRSLEEREFLTPDEVLDARIAQAKWVLEEAGDQPKAQDFVKAVLLGMVGLLRFTTHFDKKGIGQAMRLRLLREFFLELRQPWLEGVYRALVAALYAVDRPLLPLLQGEPAETSASTKATVTNIAVRRSEVEALSPEERAARREANIARDLAVRKAKEERQARFKALRCARAQPKVEEGKKNKNKNKNKKAA